MSFNNGKVKFIINGKTIDFIKNIRTENIGKHSILGIITKFEQSSITELSREHSNFPRKSTFRTMLISNSYSKNCLAKYALNFKEIMISLWNINLMHSILHTAYYYTNHIFIVEC